MMKKTAAFFRRLFASRGFRRGTRILFWVTIACIIYNLIRIMIAFTDAGIPFRDGLRFLFSISPFAGSFIWPFFAIVFFAIALGLICYYQGKGESRNTEEDIKEEKPAELSDPVQEEEISKPDHFQYH